MDLVHIPEAAALGGSLTAWDPLWTPALLLPPCDLTDQQASLSAGDTRTLHCGWTLRCGLQPASLPLPRSGLGQGVGTRGAGGRTPSEAPEAQ